MIKSFIIIFIIKIFRLLTIPFYALSLFLPYFHPVKQKNWKFVIRIIYYFLAIIIDYISISDKIKKNIIHYLSWGLTGISLFPLPLYITSKEDNILLKVFIYVFPFYILLTRSYESLFLIVFYNYLQLWIKLKFRDNPQKINNFNLIDIFIYFAISYASFFSTGNVASISGFTLSSVFRFFSVNYAMYITALILIKILLPTLFVSSAFFEICESYNYSTSDTVFILISMSEVMNIKFFFDIRDWGSWKEIGMSIAYFIISNVISFMQFLIFLFAKIIFLFDKKISKCYLLNSEIEDDKTKEIVYKEIEMGIKNSKVSDIGDINSINDIENNTDDEKLNINEFTIKEQK